MEITEKQKWISLALLSIIIPVGLLVTFRLTGVLQEPLTITISETKTLEAVNWELERPAAMIGIRDTVKSFYNDMSLLMNSSIIVGHYDSTSRYDSSYVTLVANVTALTSNGHIHSLNLTISEKDYPNTKINFFEEHQLMKFENLSRTEFKDWARTVFVNLTGVNHPRGVSFFAPIDWVLYSFQHQVHTLEMIFEVTYYNGTAYKKIVQPFLLKIGPDDNNSFETADAIEQGVNAWLYLGGYDTEDYYRIHVIQGYVININTSGSSPETTLDFYIDLYNPEKRWKAGSSSRGFSHNINFTADSTGEWFIWIYLEDDHGFYSLTINLYPPKSD